MSTNSSALAVVERPSRGAVIDLLDTALDSTKAVAQVQYVQRIMADVMKDGEHYGVIPGTGAARKCDCNKNPQCDKCHGSGELGPKKTLLKAGAEKLCYVFRLAPQFEIVRSVEEEKFILFDIRCLLIHTPSGQVVGTGMGSCSSREEKYGWRKGARNCPECGKAGSIIRGKPEYAPKDRQKRVLEGFTKGGWMCWKKKDGCGATFQDEDPAITGQSVERVPTENIWEQHNTMFKMAQKRALIAATLVTTACSDIFTQDLDDTLPDSAPPTATHEEQPPKQPPPPQAKKGPLPEAEPWVEQGTGVAHAAFSDIEAGAVPKPLRVVMLAYNNLLTVCSAEEAAQVPETYFVDKGGNSYDWEQILKTTNEKWLAAFRDKVVPAMEKRIAALEASHRTVSEIMGERPVTEQEPVK